MKMTPAEMNEQVAPRLGYEIVARDWPCGYAPGCGYYEAAMSQYDTDGNCLFILDETMIASWHNERGPVMKKGNNVVPVPSWSTDDGRAFRELWPRIEKHCWACSIGRSRRSGPPNLSIYYAGAPGTQQDFWGDTWAEAICAAFIDLVPLGETK